MKSIVFCTSFFRNEKDWNARYQRWLDHYKQIPFADSRLLMIDGMGHALPIPMWPQIIDAIDKHAHAASAKAMQ